MTRLDFAYLAICLGLVLSRPALADGYPAVELLSTSKTVVGEEILYPVHGKAVITSVIVTLAPGEETMLHKHGVPMFAYILEGEITVDYGRDGKKTYRQGDALMKPMAVAHHGINSGGLPVKILAVYLGAEGAMDVIPSQ